MAAALNLEGREEDVNQFIPTYYRNNKARRRGAESNETSEDTEVSEVEPTA